MTTTEKTYKDVRMVLQMIKDLDYESQTENKPDGSFYVRIKMENGEAGIGWDSEHEYFYFNSHTPRTTWNHKEGCYRDRPKGAFTFSLREIIHEIVSL